MAFDPSTFETLTPSQFITLTFPNTINHRCYLHTPLLRVAVLDSPAANAADPSPRISAMIVPERRETDWNFCTEQGQLQLLFNFSNISRLVLIGNNIDPNSIPSDYVRRPAIEPVEYDKLVSELKSIVIAFHPKSSFRGGLPDPVFLTYEDDVARRVIVARFVSCVVGEFSVEDVELESKELRRRLRFKRMPNLIQSQVPLTLRNLSKVELQVEDVELESKELRRRLRFKRMPNLIQSQVPLTLRNLSKVELQVDTGTLVQPYLTPMISGLCLIGSPLNERIQLGFSPRALCLGVGGGALLSFLNEKLGFEVVGVEADELVLNAARQYFGLNDGKSMQFIVGDAIKLIETVFKDTNAGLDVKFDVVMVDLDSSEARSGISAPPVEFVKKSVFKAVRSLLHDHGIVVINVIPSSELLYETLVQELRGVFHKVYEIDAKNDGNIVVMATVSLTGSSNHDSAFAKRLRDLVSGSYMDTIVEL